MAEEELNKMKDCKNGGDFQQNEAAAECEPCIETKDKQNKMWNNAERVLRDKTGLTRWGIYFVGGLLITILLLLIIVIALGASWPRTPHHQLFPICKSSSCLRASAQVSMLVNKFLVLHTLA